MRVLGCLTEAAAMHRLPPAMLVVLLTVEGGTLGHVSRNTNGTVDIGPMQVNTVWVPRIAAHWRTTPASTYAALRDNLGLAIGDDLLARGFLAFSALFGLISFELFGQYQGSLTDCTAHFDHQLARLADVLGL